MAIKKEAKILFLGTQGQTPPASLNTVTGLGQGEQRTLLNSHVRGHQIPLFLQQLLLNLGLGLGSS